MVSLLGAGSLLLSACGGKSRSTPPHDAAASDAGVGGTLQPAGRGGASGAASGAGAATNGAGTSTGATAGDAGGSSTPAAGNGGSGGTSSVSGAGGGGADTSAGGATGGTSNDGNAGAEPQGGRPQDAPGIPSLDCSEMVNDWCRVLVTESPLGNYRIAANHAGDIVLAGDDESDAANHTQIAVARYTPAGVLASASKFGSANFERVEDLAVDATDHVFVVGALRDAIAQEIVGAFIAKASPDGEPIWTRQPSVDRFATGVGTDANGNAAVLLQSGEVVQYSADGELLWTNRPDGERAGTGIAVAANGEIFVLRSKADTGALAKLSGAGELIWEHDLGETAQSDYALRLDPTGDLWTIRLDTAASLTRMISRWSATGEPLWTKPVVTEQFTADDLAFDAAGNAFVIGMANDFGISYYGSYLEKYDPDGNPLWGTQLTLRSGLTRDLAVTPDGTVFVTGDQPQAPAGAFVTRVTPP